MPLLKPLTPRDGRQSKMALCVARGTRRMLRKLDFSTVAELPLLSGRRADIVALASDGTILVVEIKSSVADFRADSKWPEYRAHCDRLFFAIPESVPGEIMPKDAGLILADAYSAGDFARGAGASDGTRHPPRDVDPVWTCGSASPAPLE